MEISLGESLGDIPLHQHPPGPGVGAPALDRSGQLWRGPQQGQGKGGIVSHAIPLLFRAVMWMRIRK